MGLYRWTTNGIAGEKGITMQLDEQLISDAQISAFIVGNFDTREFLLVDTSLWPPPACIYGRGFVFVGTVGIVNGAPRSAFAVEIDDAAVSAIAMEWVRYLAARIMPYLRLPDEESVQFLERLHALPDVRETVRGR